MSSRDDRTNLLVILEDSFGNCMLDQVKPYKHKHRAMVPSGLAAHNEELGWMSCSWRKMRSSICCIMILSYRAR